MNLQEELKALKERIAELEEQAKEEQEFPRDGDRYWYIDDEGMVHYSDFENEPSDKNSLKIGNVFCTKNEAEFQVEKLKVEVELRKFSRPFDPSEDNFFMLYSTNEGSLDIWRMAYLKAQGATYFESEEKAQRAIDFIGEERIKKYIFGVED